MKVSHQNANVRNKFLASLLAVIAGNFSARPIQEVGVDGPFLITSLVFAASLATMLYATSKIHKLPSPN